MDQSTSGSASGQAIGVDSRATVRFSPDRIAEFTVALPRDADPGRGVISCESPLGRALMGKRQGDRAEYSVDGRAFQVEILAVIAEPAES